MARGIGPSASKDSLLRSSVHTASFTSFASNASDPSEALFAQMPKCPPPLRLEQLRTLQKSDSRSKFRPRKVRKDTRGVVKARKDRAYATHGDWKRDVSRRQVERAHHS